MLCFIIEIQKEVIINLYNFQNFSTLRKPFRILLGVQHLKYFTSPYKKTKNSIKRTSPGRIQIHTSLIVSVVSFISVFCECFHLLIKLILLSIKKYKLKKKCSEMGPLLFFYTKYYQFFQVMMKVSVSTNEEQKNKRPLPFIKS